MDAGTYDLEVQLAGTENVALEVPRAKPDTGVVYTVFAVSLAGGEPALTAVPSADNVMATTLPATGGQPISSLPDPIALALGGLLLAGGLVLRTRTRKIEPSSSTSNRMSQEGSFKRSVHLVYGPPERTIKARPFEKRTLDFSDFYDPCFTNK